MRKPVILRKLLGILLALFGAIIIIELIPLWLWYSFLGIFVLLFVLFLFRIF